MVIQHAETPGLGDKMETSAFRKQFENFDFTTHTMEVKKKGGDIDAITAATVSSMAYCKAMQNAYNALLKTTIFDQQQLEPTASEEPKANAVDSVETKENSKPLMRKIIDDEEFDNKQPEQVKKEQKKKVPTVDTAKKTLKTTDTTTGNKIKQKEKTTNTSAPLNDPAIDIDATSGATL
jgi:hypothetical protein